MVQSNHKSAGLTLIEVLIALAIFSIALIAMIKATSQTIKNTIYIQDKTIAHWVGLQIMNETRSGFLKLPTQGNILSHETEMLGENWTWEAHTKATDNPHIVAIYVDVLHQPDQAKLANLVSYNYVKTKS